MNQIQVRILNPWEVHTAEQTMVCAARLTQAGHKIKDLDDFIDLYNKPYTRKTVQTMTSLPHPTIQKFGVINIVVVGASRRFLAQITRHQNEVRFMSASLQYSDYSGAAGFVVPYEIEVTGQREQYLTACKTAMQAYECAINNGSGRDAAGYMAPQGLRNILLISATPYQWKHMIAQRTCRRNTLETRYVMLKIWEMLFEVDPLLFSMDTTSPFCMTQYCREGKMSCGEPIHASTPTDILRDDFPFYYKEDENNGN